MSHPEHAHSHAHSHDCSCGHEHNHGPSYLQRWVTSVAIVGVLLIVLKPFIISQMLMRVTSYSANTSYGDVLRMCRKILALDGGNIQAWTALGYAYMDSGRVDKAIPVFEKVLSLDRQDKGAASFELGRAFYAKGDDRRAIEYFERVRSAGPKAAALLDADVLKYRHGTSSFRSINSMETLLQMLADAYQKTGQPAKAQEAEKEYEDYQSKHSKLFF